MDLFLMYTAPQVLLMEYVYVFAGWYTRGDLAGTGVHVSNQ